MKPPGSVKPERAFHDFRGRVEVLVKTHDSVSLFIGYGKDSRCSHARFRHTSSPGPAD
jgi:hypothetical protein